MTFRAFLVSLFTSPFFLASSMAGAEPAFVEQDGQVVVEAEHFVNRTGDDSHAWFQVPQEEPGTPSEFANFRGDGYIQALPNSNGGSAPLEPPIVQYTIQITTVGTYRLYVRWAAPDNNSDTFYASIPGLSDGPGGTVADWYRYVRISSALDFSTGPTWFGSGGRERTDSPFTNGESPVVWNIESPGTYTVQFDMREDGAAIDTFVFQLADLPPPSGLGPPESPVVCFTPCAVECLEGSTGPLNVTSGPSALAGAGTSKPTGISRASRLDPMVFRRFRDNVLSGTPAGRRLSALYSAHSLEVVRLLVTNSALRSDLLEGLLLWQDTAAGLADGSLTAVAVTPAQARIVDEVANRLATVASRGLREAIEAQRRRVPPGLSLAQALLAEIGHPSQNSRGRGRGNR